MIFQLFGREMLSDAALIGKCMIFSTVTDSQIPKKIDSCGSVGKFSVEKSRKLRFLVEFEDDIQLRCLAED